MLNENRKKPLSLCLCIYWLPITSVHKLNTTDTIEWEAIQFSYFSAFSCVFVGSTHVLRKYLIVLDFFGYVHLLLRQFCHHWSPTHTNTHVDILLCFFNIHPKHCCPIYRNWHITFLLPFKRKCDAKWHAPLLKSVEQK